MNSIPSAPYVHDEQTACEVVESRIWVHGRVCPKHATVGESGDAFDRAMDTALLSGDEHPQWPRRLVAAIALVDLDPLDFAPGQCLGLVDHAGQGMAVDRHARSRLHAA